MIFAKALSCASSGSSCTRPQSPRYSSADRIAIASTRCRHVCASCCSRRKCASTSLITTRAAEVRGRNAFMTRLGDAFSSRSNTRRTAARRLVPVTSPRTEASLGRMSTENATASPRSVPLFMRFPTASTTARNRTTVASLSSHLHAAVTTLTAAVKSSTAASHVLCKCQNCNLHSLCGTWAKACKLASGMSHGLSGYLSASALKTSTSC
mmetsp:Transcript_18620/g.44857  ORF Transcript_18620/g.44857 Transcript_18620/m.44857 type:complete len:210 (-) Transcript_18620:129-758(-)